MGPALPRGAPDPSGDPGELRPASPCRNGWSRPWWSCWTICPRPQPARSTSTSWSRPPPRWSARSSHPPVPSRPASPRSGPICWVVRCPTRTRGSSPWVGTPCSLPGWWRASGRSSTSRSALLTSCALRRSQRSPRRCARRACPSARFLEPGPGIDVAQAASLLERMDELDDDQVDALLRILGGSCEQRRAYPGGEVIIPGQAGLRDAAARRQQLADQLAGPRSAPGTAGQAPVQAVHPVAAGPAVQRLPRERRPAAEGTAGPPGAARGSALPVPAARVAPQPHRAARRRGCPGPARRTRAGRPGDELFEPGWRPQGPLSACRCQVLGGSAQPGPLRPSSAVRSGGQGWRHWARRTTSSYSSSTTWPVTRRRWRCSSTRSRSATPPPAPGLPCPCPPPHHRGTSPPVSSPCRTATRWLPLSAVTSTSSWERTTARPSPSRRTGAPALLRS